MSKKNLISVPLMMMEQITPNAFVNKLSKDRIPPEPPKFQIRDIIKWEDGVVKRHGVISGIKINDYYKGWYYDIITIRLYDGVIEEIGKLEKHLELFEEDYGIKDK